VGGAAEEDEGKRRREEEPIYKRQGEAAARMAIGQLSVGFLCVLAPRGTPLLMRWKR
jgi:hypothetical protein